MNADSSPGAIAARLRTILAAEDADAIVGTAARLDVSEHELLRSIDPANPRPAWDVVVAVIRHHAIDPCWLVTGEYHGATHRAALRGAAAFTDEDLARLVSQAAAESGTASSPAE